MVCLNVIFSLPSYFENILFCIPMARFTYKCYIAINHSVPVRLFIFWLYSNFFFQQILFDSESCISPSLSLNSTSFYVCMYACVNVYMYECIKVFIHLFICLFMSTFVYLLIEQYLCFTIPNSMWYNLQKKITCNILTYVYKFRMETRTSLSNGTRCTHIYIKYD